MIARVEGLEPSRLTELLRPLVRSEQRAVVFDDELRFRVVPATAPDGLILAAPRAVDFPGDFALVPRAKTISFSKENQTADDEAAIQIEFSSVRATPFSDLP